MQQLQRLLFRQGNKCFFCGDPIPEGQASVEHLNALSNDGEKSDENSVACCRTVNAALANLPVKEKFRAVLNHKGQFACPAQSISIAPAKLQHTPTAEAQKLLPEVVENLRKRGAARPNNAETLKNSVATSFRQASPEVLKAVLVLLKQNGYTAEHNGKLSYPGL